MSGNKVDKYAFQGHFDRKLYFSESDIAHYLEDQDVIVNESTLRWHIHQLKESDVLYRVKPGVYTLIQKNNFAPTLSRKAARIHKKVTGAFSPDLSCIIWSTAWLHEFMILQPTQQMIILETEKEWAPSLFYILKDHGLPAFLNPSEEIIDRYITGTTESYVVKSMVSRSPMLSINQNTRVASLEKMLVDLFCDTNLFAAYQGSELENIFTQAWKKYSLNLSVLVNYAKRRKRLEGLLRFTSTLTDQEFHEMLSI